MTSYQQLTVIYEALALAKLKIKISPQPPQVGILRWRKQTDTQADGHGNLMTDLAHMAEAVNIPNPQDTFLDVCG